MKLDELTKENRIAAITNIIKVMLADGIIKPEEEEYLEERRRRLKLTEEEVKNIVNTAGQFGLKPPRNFREGNAQLVDMIFMMKADGEIHPFEKELCIEFGTKIGLSQLRVEILIDTITTGLKKGHSRKKIEETTLIIDI